MISGSVRGAVKPITIVALHGHPIGWLRARGSHDVQSSSSVDAHQQDEYPDATDFRCSLVKVTSLTPLTEESIPDSYASPFQRLQEVRDGPVRVCHRTYAAHARHIVRGHHDLSAEN